MVLVGPKEPNPGDTNGVQSTVMTLIGCAVTGPAANIPAVRAAAMTQNRFFMTFSNERRNPPLLDAHNGSSSDERPRLKLLAGWLLQVLSRPSCMETYCLFVHSKVAVRR
jgi:hypothetical protein